jgi:hypothetical protein
MLDDLVGMSGMKSMSFVYVDVNSGSLSKGLNTPSILAYFLGILCDPTITNLYLKQIFVKAVALRSFIELIVLR